MTQQIGTGPATSKDQPHRRQQSRIIPVIPKQLSRAKSTKKPAVVEAEEAAPVKTSNGPTEICESNGVHNAHEDVLEVPDTPSSGEPTTARSEENKENSAKSQTETSISSRATPLESPKDSPLNQDHNHTSKSTTPVENQPLKDATPSEKPRTALPPSFYPAKQSSAPYTSSHNQTSKPFVLNPAQHNQFIFGGQVDSSNASPVPPTSAGSGMSSSGTFPIANGGDQGVTYPATHRGPPSNGSFSAPSMPPFSPYETSETFYSLPNPPTQWQQPHAQPNMLPQAPPQFQGTQFDGYAHTSRSESQVSLPPIDQQYQDRNRPVHSHGRSIQNSMTFQPGASAFPEFPRHQGSFSRPSRHPPPRQTDIVGLGPYLNSQLGDPEFADCILIFEDSPVRVPAHSVLLARLPKLSHMLRSKENVQKVEYQGMSLRALEFPRLAYFKQTESFCDAVRFVYGGPPADEHRFLSLASGSPQQAMERILSYAAAGHTLGQAEIAFPAIFMASKHLTWDSLETALEFALDGTLSPQQPATADEAIQVNGSTNHSTEPTYGLHAIGLLDNIVNFVRWNIPRDFQLDLSAPQLPNMERLPSNLLQRPTIAHASRSSVSDPRFRGIRLGEFQSQTAAATMLSSALLSLPFSVLQTVIEDVQLQQRLGLGAEQVLRPIVEEREKRRQHAYTTYKKRAEVVNGDLESMSLAQTLRLVEELHVVDHELPRLRLRRREEDSS